MKRAPIEKTVPHECVNSTKVISFSAFICHGADLTCRTAMDCSWCKKPNAPARFPNANVFVCNEICQKNYWNSLTGAEKDLLVGTKEITSDELNTAKPLPHFTTINVSLIYSNSSDAKIVRRVEKTSRTVFFKFNPDRVTYAQVAEQLSKLRSQLNQPNFWESRERDPSPVRQTVRRIVFPAKSQSLEEAQRDREFHTSKAKDVRETELTIELEETLESVASLIRGHVSSGLSEVERAAMFEDIIAWLKVHRPNLVKQAGKDFVFEILAEISDNP